jgi:hypothetical protein
MEPQSAPRVCRRAGCHFICGRRTSGRGWFQHCGQACGYADRRARRVVTQSGPEAEAEAAELMRIYAALDARRSPRERIDGLFPATEQRDA